MTWLPRITLILFVIVLTNWVMVSTIGHSLLGGDLFTLFFIIFLVLFVLTLFRPLMRKVLWRVRHRLLVTFFLIGVLPIMLISAIVALGFYMMVGATANYLSQAELNRRLDQVQTTARFLSQNLADAGSRISPEAVPERVLIRSGNRTIAKPGPIAQFPSWSTPGFKGVVRTSAREYFMAAHVEVQGQPRVDVFAYAPLDDRILSEFLPGVGSVRIFRLRDIGATADDVGEIDLTQLRPVLDSANIVPAPPSRGFWDLPPFAGWPLIVRELDTGRTDDHGVNVTARPSTVVSQLLSPLGELARPVVISFFFIVALLVGVELVAAVCSVQLARSLTQTVHDLYTGTKRVEIGDFSYRIPVRTTDQLSDLATSFNGMTGRIEQLIVEVKEKEKLEAELEIARQVQAQLFPKEVPKLKTLELFGMCNPARVVSGDYYDFIPLAGGSTAVVIGDISGKGISAALLMASLQSSLHAQLTMGGKGEVSTATLVARLNRQLYENTPPEKYATFYCAVYDDESSRLLYTNAGHLAPMIVRGTDIIRLESNGMVVGMFPDFAYEQSVVELERGDLFAAFTDGITESENAQGEQFGEERLADLLIRYRERPLDEIAGLVTGEIRDWASDLDNQDDTTILLARRL